ncbi:unknown [Clostridium sp. CAG:226]|nr:unknown [Clostridium sp. CAG:226]
MPMVPQEVPVANPIAAPIMNITAGRNSLRLPALAMAALTNSAEYMAKRVKEQSVQAKVSISMGAIICMKPWGMDSMDFSNVNAPRIQK